MSDAAERPRFDSDGPIPPAVQCDRCLGYGHRTQDCPVAPAARSSRIVAYGVSAEAKIEPWPDDARYVRVSLHVEPTPGGIAPEAYSVLVKKPVVP